MSFSKSIVTALTLVLPLCASAEGVRPGAGELTFQWLELQRSGSQASVHPEGISADVSESIYQRYLKSFTHPIPDSFKRDQELNFVTGNSRSQ